MPGHIKDAVLTNDKATLISPLEVDNNAYQQLPQQNLLPDLASHISTQTAVLQRATNGRLSRAGDSLLQLQRHYGNQHVQRVVAQAEPPIVQTKLMLGPVGDKYEQEADQIAQQVVTGKNGQVQRQVTGDGGTAVTPEIETAINQAKGEGRPLNSHLQETMSQTLGADFSPVRVHTDQQADQLNQSLQARAFTTGPDIFFRRGEYHSGNTQSQQLLAHELTHVVQQGGAKATSLAEPSEAASLSTPIVQRQNRVTKESGGAWFTPPLKKLDDTFQDVMDDNGIPREFNIDRAPNPVVKWSDFKHHQSGQYYRPKKVEAIIDTAPKSGESRAPVIGEYGHLGEHELALFGGDVSKNNYDGGHLIGHQFLGNAGDVHGNLAPQDENSNQKSYRIFEEILTAGFYQSSSNKLSPVDVTIELGYSTDFKFTPQELHDRGILPAKVIGLLPYKGLDKTDQIDFETCVPYTWEGGAQGQKSAKSVQKDITGSGYLFNFQLDKSTIENQIPAFFGGPSHTPIRIPLHAIQSLASPSPSQTLVGGLNLESFFAFQPTPQYLSTLPLLLTAPKPLAVPSFGNAPAVTQLSGKVKIADLLKLDPKSSSNKLSNQSKDYNILNEIASHKAIVEMIKYMKKMGYTPPMTQRAWSETVETVAAKQTVTGRGVTQKSQAVVPAKGRKKFLALARDSNIDYTST